MSSEDAVGKRIRDCREAQKISQTQLAKLLGLSSAAIWNWETQGRVPRPKTLSKVAEILHVSEEYLVEGTGSPQRASKKPQTETVVSEESVASELEKIRAKIARLMGFELSRIRLEVTVV
jgi:transcriptional regulator with XRE-family HTH domain